MTKDRLFDRRYALELIQIAQGDLDSAEVLASDLSRGRKENICFSAQQAIEKCLKAVLCAQGKPVPLTHTIELILDRLGADSQPPQAEGLLELTDYATVKRYQQGSEVITPEDISAVLEVARRVIAWAKANVN